MPLYDDTTKAPRQKSSERNALHDFASYNCLFTLSGCNESDLDSQKRFLTSPLRDVIARSAGIGEGGSTAADARFSRDGGNLTNEMTIKAKKIEESYTISRDILFRNHDIFFENVNILSTVGPNTERNLSNFTKMTFELHEPYGVTLVEKLRACAYNNGYKDHLAAPFLLTIEWKGFDELGNPLQDKTKSLVRRIPIFISRLEFEVNEAGARYEVLAVPYPEMAYDDSYKFPRTSFAANVTTVPAWIGTVEVALDQQMQDEIDGNFRTFKDHYEFNIDEIKHLIGPGETVTETNESIFNTSTVKETVEEDTFGPDDDLLSQDKAQTKSKAIGMQFDKYTSVVKGFEDVIRSTKFFQDVTGNFWKTLTAGEFTQEELTDIFMSEDKFSKLLEGNQYVDWFMIKPQVKTMVEKGIDPITKMHPKRIIFKAVPYKVHVCKLLTAGLSFGNVDWKKYARRRYDYIYTGDNVDVQNLRINYKTGYYYRNIRDDDDTPGDTGKFKAIKASVKKLLGQEETPEPALPLRQYPSSLKQINFAKRISPKNTRAQEFYDYLLNPIADMLVVELEILGDPAYVAQDIFSPYEDRVMEEGEYDFQRNSFNMQSHMPVVHLTYRMPADIRESEGVMFDKRFLDDNLFFSGAYQVVKVDSSMNQGEFKQTLTMVRLNNQQGVGSAPKELIKAAQGGAIEILSESNVKRNLRKDLLK